MPANSKIIYIMGVSSCGKSTVGKLLSNKAGLPFFDGDDFHSEKNILKMKSGKALDDSDRQGWLEEINAFANVQALGKGAIIACSALKKKYRETLRKGLQEKVTFVFLKGNFQTIIKRMEGRREHFMPLALLEAQFRDLEEPEQAVVIDIRLPLQKIVEGLRADVITN